MPKPKYHILVCKNTRPPGHPKGSCGEKGAMGVLNQFNFGVMERNLIGQVIVTPTDCLGPCQLGPTVVVYPDGVWYKSVTEADVAVILDAHIGKGKPVDRLKLPDEVWGQPARCRWRATRQRLTSATKRPRPGLPPAWGSPA